MAWYWIVLIIFVYLVISGIVLFYMADGKDALSSGIASLMWPVSIPIVIGLMIAYKITNK